jgi:hypothetical protein
MIQWSLLSATSAKSSLEIFAEVTEQTASEWNKKNNEQQKSSKYQ